jgi:hypothetical protein
MSLHRYLPQAKTWLHLWGDDDWKESEHPRGQPENAGQFAEGGAAGPAAEPAEGPSKKPAAKPAAKRARAPAAAPRVRKPKLGAEQTFISPNTGNLTFSGAEHELHGPRQGVFHDIADAIDIRMGLRQRKGKTDVIGAWSDGAENTLMVTFPKSADPMLVRAATAMKAHLADQKAALIFQPNDQGANAMAHFEEEGDLADIHERLLQKGLANHTLEPTEHGATVHIFVNNQAEMDAVDRAVDGDVHFVQGNGEFIGTTLEGSDDEQRADARAVYTGIIDAAESSGALEAGHIREIWADSNNHWRSATGADKGVGLIGSQGHPALISTRRPTKAGALESDHYRRPDLASMKQEPEKFRKNMELLLNPEAYPNFRPGELDGKTPDEIAEIAIAHAMANLEFLYRNTDEEVRTQGPQWYEGAHGMAEREAKKYKLPIQTTAGVFAALSPQKNWNENVYLAKTLIDIVQNHRDEAWDDDMTATGAAIWKAKHDPPSDADKANRAAFQTVMTGKKTYSELTDPIDKAVWVRTYDEAHSDRHFDELSPDGTPTGLAMKVDPADPDKKIPAQAAWQSNSAISGAIEALESGGDRNVISRAMGDMHKVRSFYNNILDPHSENGDVTMDTHAVGAALLAPMSGKAQAVMHNLHTNPSNEALVEAKKHGWHGTTSSKLSGLQGTYGLWADAYRRTAEKLGIEPRVLQSVTWEAKRRLMPDNLSKAKRDEMNGAWSVYHDGGADLKTTQQKILDIARRESRPGEEPAEPEVETEEEESSGDARRGSRGAMDGQAWLGAEPRELHRGQLGQHPARAVGLRKRDAAPGGAARSLAVRGRVTLGRGIYLHIH